MIKLLLILLVLVGCGRLPDEGKLKRQTASIRISYNGLQFQDMDFQRGRFARAITGLQDPFPVYHFIAVEPDVDYLWLDNDMTAEVLVPLETPLWVSYMNWTEDQPDIYYQYGVSDEFIVTHDSPEKVVVNISVDVNPEYPFPEDETTDTETEEETETVDNETTVDETLLVHYKFEDDLTDNSSYGLDLENGDGTITFNPDGVDGKAGYFNGGTYAYTEDIDIAETDNFTISFWIKPYSTPWTVNNEVVYLITGMTQWDSVMSTGTTTSGGRFQIDYSGSGKLRFNATGTLVEIDLDANEWQHFVFTKVVQTAYTSYDHTLLYYKNGELLGHETQANTYWELLKIGMNRNSGGYWKGFIDDFRIYNRTLIPDEVEELYESYE
jgi:hypothetical protein